MLSHLKTIKTKIANAAKIQKQIKCIEKDPEYLDEKGIEKEYEKTSEIISSAMKIDEEVSRLESDPYFLTEDQIKVLEDRVSRFLKMAAMPFPCNVHLTTSDTQMSTF